MKKRWIIPGVIILAIIGGLYVRGNAEGKRAITEVKTATVERGDIQSYLSTTAIIQSVDQKQYFGLQAKVKEVHVKVGDPVEKGDVLITYEVQDLSTSLRQAEIQYSNALLQKQELVNQDNQIRSKIAEYEADLKELKESNDPMNQTKIENLKQQINALQPITKERMQQTENAVELAKLTLDSTKQKNAENKDQIVAENSGVVTEVTVVVGTVGNAIQPAIIVQDIENLKAVASVGRYDANQVAVGQEALIRSGNEVYKGKISFVDPVAKRTMSASGSETLLGIEIAILEKVPQLKIDFNVDVDILLGEAIDVIKVPTESIKTDREGRYYVYIVEEQQAVEKEVILGLQSDMEAQILKGVEMGEEIILNPRANIQKGSRVRTGGEK